MNRHATDEREMNTASNRPWARAAGAQDKHLTRTRRGQGHDIVGAGRRDGAHSALRPHEYSASALARGFAGQLLEVLLGRRPLRQLSDRLDKPVAGLLATLVRSGRAVAPDSRLRSVHACATSSTTVEACAIIADSKRARAATIKLERFHTDWTCTLFRLV